MATEIKNVVADVVYVVLDVLAGLMVVSGVLAGLAVALGFMGF